MLNLDAVETAIESSNHTLTANHLKVGDRVGFNHKAHALTGIIKRLNPKTVTLMTDTCHHQWRVAYAYLHRVYNSTQGENNE